MSQIRISEHISGMHLPYEQMKCISSSYGNVTPMKQFQHLYPGAMINPCPVMKYHVGYMHRTQQSLPGWLVRMVLSAASKCIRNQKLAPWTIPSFTVRNIHTQSTSDTGLYIPTKVYVTFYQGVRTNVKGDVSILEVIHKIMFVLKIEMQRIHRLRDVIVHQVERVFHKSIRWS